MAAGTKETGLSLYGTIKKAQVSTGVALLGKDRFKTDYIMSKILKIGVFLFIVCTIVVGWSIISPYINHISDILFKNISSHDNHLFNTNVLEVHITQGGRTPIAIFFSWVAVFVIYTTVIAADWRVKFNFTAVERGKNYIKRDLGHLLAFLLFNSILFTLEVASFAHFGANKFVSNNVDKFQTENNQYKHLDSINNNEVNAIKIEELELIAEKEALISEKDYALSNMNIWIKRQGIDKYQIAFGHKGLKIKVDEYKKEASELGKRINKKKENIAAKRKEKDIKITAIHWRDKELEKEFNDDIRTSKAAWGINGSLLFFFLFGLIKLQKKLVTEKYSVKEYNRKRLPSSRKSTNWIGDNYKKVKKATANYITERASSAVKKVTGSNKDTSAKPKSEPVRNEKRTSSSDKTNQFEKKRTSSRKSEPVQSALDIALAKYNKKEEELKNGAYSGVHSIFLELMNTGRYKFDDGQDIQELKVNETFRRLEHHPELNFTEGQLRGHYSRNYVKVLKPLLETIRGQAELSF